MNVKNVNVVCLQLRQRIPQGHVQRLLVVARVVDSLSLAVLFHSVVGRELGCDDLCHLVSNRASVSTSLASLP